MLGLDRFFEDADDDPISAESASRGVIFDRYREFSALARRLEADEKSLGMATHSQELEALWERRSQLARELVDTPAPAIPDVVFKMTIVSSLVEDGEVRLGLTQQCVEGLCHVDRSLLEVRRRCSRGYEENQLRRISVSARGHTSGDLALPPVHTQLS